MSSELVVRLLKEEVDRLKKALDKQEYACGENDPGKIILDCNIQFIQVLQDFKDKKITDVERDIKAKSLYEREKVAKDRLKTFNIIRELDKLTKLKLEYQNANHEYQNAQYYVNIRKMRGSDAKKTE